LNDLLTNGQFLVDKDYQDLVNGEECCSDYDDEYDDEEEIEEEEEEEDSHYGDEEECCTQGCCNHQQNKTISYGKDEYLEEETIIECEIVNKNGFRPRNYNLEDEEEEEGEEVLDEGESSEEEAGAQHYRYPQQ
jgi:hypothetical protein